MGRLWMRFSTLFTLAGIVALVGGAVLWKTGRLTIGSGGTPAAHAAAGEKENGEQQPGATPAAAAAGTKGTPAPPPPPQLDEKMAKTWFYRMERVKTDLARQDRELEGKRQALIKTASAQQNLTEALAELLAVIQQETDPEENGPAAAGGGGGPATDPQAALERTLADPAALSALVQDLKAMTMRARRAPKLLVTLQEMKPEQAATLLGESIELELATDILRRMAAEDQAAILDRLVQSDPNRAGAIFTRLAGEKEEG